MNQTRTRVDRQAIKTMVSLGGAYIKHPQIKISHTQLFHSDGTHLSKLGNDLFLNNLRTHNRGQNQVKAIPSSLALVGSIYLRWGRDAVTNM